MTYAAYDVLFASDLPFPTWAMNSVIVTLVVTAGRVLLCSAAGYALARLHVPRAEASSTPVWWA